MLAGLSVASLLLAGAAQAGVRILLVEQNLAVAVAVAQRHLVRVAGRFATELTSEQLMSDPELQRRYLGVEPLAD